VLVTDGLLGSFLPNAVRAACEPHDVESVAALIHEGATGDPPIPTFVIGTFGPCDLVDENVVPRANLDRFAVSGGTESAVLVDAEHNVTAELEAALDRAFPTSISCE
jgi:hypothetical protein